ncbi:MFS general substrate transporter [Xylariaceae sp. FL0255]|nr:MFS general substrate transporter [Xylariaceae sp. FL0255]
MAAGSSRRTSDENIYHSDRRPLHMVNHDVEKASEATSPTTPVLTPPRQPFSDAEQRFQPKSFKFWSIIISTFLALFLVALDRTIVGTASPRITEEFHSLGDIGWYGSAYQLTTAASQLLFGRIYKFYETKKTFLLTVVLFEVGSVVCGAAPNSIAFIIGRAIAGVGGAGVFSGCTIIMISMVPLHKRPMFQGAFGAVFGLASVLGPIVGGALTEGVSWRWCFYINLPIGAAAVVCIIFILRPSQPQHPPATIWQQIRRLDPLGTLLFVPSIVSLLIALQWGGSTYSWGNYRIIVLFVFFGVLLIGFICVQIFMPETATVPARIICKRSIIFATLFMFSLAGSFLLVVYYLPIWFQVVKGASPAQSGVYTIPFVLSMVIGSTLSGVFTQKVGYYVPAMIASPSLLAAGQGLMSTFAVNTGSSHWIGFQVVAGFGLGLGMQASSLAAQAVLPMPDVPIGIAIMFFAQQLGGGIFTSVGQNLLSTYLVSHLDGIPGINPSEVTSEGATQLVSSVAPQYQLEVREVYNRAISRIFLTAMGVALVAVVSALFMEWKNVKKTGPPKGGPPGRQAPAADAPGPNSDSVHSKPPSVDHVPQSSRNSYSDDPAVTERKVEADIDQLAAKPTAGCDHCEHCRLSRALTLTPSEHPSMVALSTQTPSPTNAHHPSGSHSQLYHQQPSPPADALEEAARLATLARETLAQLEELTRPFSGLHNNTTVRGGRYSYDGARSQQQGPGTGAAVPVRDLRRQSIAAPEVTPRRHHRMGLNATTEELAENARRVSAQLEREASEDREKELEAMRQRKWQGSQPSAPSTHSPQSPVSHKSDLAPES